MTHDRRIMLATVLLTIFTGASSVLAQDGNRLIQQTCVACHNEFTLQGGLNLQGFDAENPHLSPVIAEKLIRKLRSGQMPPRELPRDEAVIANLVEMLEDKLDRHAREQKRAGSRPFQRVNRAEYEQLIYDLLGLTIDSAEWLPEDRISASFDNIADSQDFQCAADPCPPEWLGVFVAAPATRIFLFGVAEVLAAGRRRPHARQRAAQQILRGRRQRNRVRPGLFDADVR